MGSGYKTDAPADDLFKVTVGTTLTLTWKVVVVDGYQLFYVNDELRVVNKGGSAVTAFSASAEQAKVRFYDMKAYMTATDKDGFTAQKALIQADLNAYSGYANGSYRV